MADERAFDVWNQAVLTTVINRPPAGRAPGAAEDTAPLGAQIAPLKTHPARNAKLSVSEVVPFGKGQFRAPDASIPFFKPQIAWSEQLITLALLDEREPISEEDWMKLNSPVEEIRRSVGMDIVDKGRTLKTRNERLTEWMRWQAFQGELTIPYDNGASNLYVNYGLRATHKPVASTLWSSTSTADPVSDIQAWSEVIAADTGYYGNKIHMNSKTYGYLVNNVNVKNAINFYAPSANTIFRPRREDILNLFSTFAVGMELVIYDNGFRDSPTDPALTTFPIGTTSLTKYLPDGYVLMTTDYTLDGVQIADTLDGQVTVRTGFASTETRQGEQAEVQLHSESYTHFLRYASARIPRILLPDAFLWARVA